MRRNDWGPRCGHSACSQHYIDTGDAGCVEPRLDHEPATRDFKWHVCGACGQKWGDEADDYERCPACLCAAAALLAAALEVTTQFCDFEAMTDEAAAAMRALRAESKGLSVTIGIDLASGPDRQVTVTLECRCGRIQPGDIFCPECGEGEPVAPGPRRSSGGGDHERA